MVPGAGAKAVVSVLFVRDESVHRYGGVLLLGIPVRSSMARGPSVFWKGVCMKPAEKWNAVHERDEATCQTCGTVHSAGNTHTVSTLFPDERTDWLTVSLSDLLFMCYPCIEKVRHDMAKGVISAGNEEVVYEFKRRRRIALDRRQEESDAACVGGASEGAH